MQEKLTYGINCFLFASFFKLSNWLIVCTSIHIVDHDRVVLPFACVELLATSSVSHCLLRYLIGLSLFSTLTPMRLICESRSQLEQQLELAKRGSVSTRRGRGEGALRLHGTNGRLLIQNHASGKEVRGLLLLGTPHPSSSYPITAAIHGALTYGQQFVMVSPHFSSLISIC